MIHNLKVNRLSQEIGPANQSIMEIIKLNLGCGKDIRQGYTNLDIDPVSDEVLKHDVENLSDFADDSVSEILACDIIEHFPLQKINPILKEWCRVIKPGGELVIQTPDIEVIFNDYYRQAFRGTITWARLSRIIHGKDEPFQTHYVSLSFQWLKEILEQHSMSVVSKKNQNQNMIVIARKNAVSDIEINTGKLKPVKVAKFVISIVRELKKLCRRHRMIRSLGLDKFLDSIIDNVLLFRDKSIIVPVNDGLEVIVKPRKDTGLERELLETGAYETGTVEVMKKILEEGDAFIDVGSNIGYISLIAAKQLASTGKIYSFEPDPEIFTALSKNIEINGCKDIKAYQTALGSSPSTEHIYRKIFKRDSGTLMGPEGNSLGGGKVSVVTLDSFVKSNRIDTAKMLKIDVGGWELEVLKGAKEFLSKPKAPILSINYSYYQPTHGGSLSEVYDFIFTVNKYRCFKLDGGKGRPGRLVEIKGTRDLPSFDNMFCFLPKHLENINEELLV